MCWHGCIAAATKSHPCSILPPPLAPLPLQPGARGLNLQVGQVSVNLNGIVFAASAGASLYDITLSHVSVMQARAPGWVGGWLACCLGGGQAGACGKVVLYLPAVCCMLTDGCVPWFMQENQNSIVFEAANAGALFDGVTARVNFLVTGRCQRPVGPLRYHCCLHFCCGWVGWSAPLTLTLSVASFCGCQWLQVAAWPPLPPVLAWCSPAPHPSWPKPKSLCRCARACAML
jgi:hypothetical protein